MSEEIQGTDYEEVCKERDYYLSQLAALREELDIAKGVIASQGETIGRVVSERDGAQQRLADAERQNASMRDALIKIIEMNRQQAKDQYGDAEKAESWSCITVARAALNKPEEAKS